MSLCTHRPAALATIVALTACSAKPLDRAGTSHARDVATTPGAIASASTASGPDAAAAPSASAIGTAPTSTALSLEPECVGSSFDLDAVLAKSSAQRIDKDENGRRRARAGLCHHAGDMTQAAAFAGPDAIEIRVTATPSRVAPGASTKLSVTFVNVSATPRTLVFDRCADAPSITAEAHDGKGQRADVAPTDIGCGISRACVNARAAITLAPGGSVSTQGEYRANILATQTDCSEKVKAPLPAGDYELQVRTPLLVVDPQNPRTLTYRVGSGKLSVGR